MELIPTLVLSGCNFVFPLIASFVTKLERWPYSASVLKSDIWKIYATRISNVLVFAVLNYEFMFNKAWFRATAVIKQQSDYKCREDQVGIEFAKLVLILHRE